MSDAAAPAVSAAVQLVADAINDYEAFAASGQKSPIAAFAFFGNLAGDVMNIIANATDLPRELGVMDAALVEQLIAEFGQKLNLPTPQAQAILQAALNVAHDCVANYNDVVALVHAIQNARTTPPASAPA